MLVASKEAKVKRFVYAGSSSTTEIILTFLKSKIQLVDLSVLTQLLSTLMNYMQIPLKSI